MRITALQSHTEHADSETKTPVIRYLPESDLPVVLGNDKILMPQMSSPLLIHDPAGAKVVDTALKKERFISVLPKANSRDAPQKKYFGCVGKITSFTEQEINVYYLVIEGVHRFACIKSKLDFAEMAVKAPDYTFFAEDSSQRQVSILPYYHNLILKRLQPYCKKMDYQFDPGILAKNDSRLLVNYLTISMPLTTQERYALLQTNSLAEQLKLLIALMDYAIEHMDIKMNMH